MHQSTATMINQSNVSATSTRRTRSHNGRSRQRMIQHSTCASASPPCEVSLYFACMSAPVRRMVSIA